MVTRDQVRAMFEAKMRGESHPYAVVELIHEFWVVADEPGGSRLAAIAKVYLEEGVVIHVPLHLPDIKDPKSIRYEWPKGVNFLTQANKNLVEIRIFNAFVREVEKLSEDSSRWEKKREEEFYSEAIKSLPWRRLGFTKPEKDREKVKTSWRKYTKKFHPDNVETGNEKKFRFVNEAYNEICDGMKELGYWK